MAYIGWELPEDERSKLLRMFQPAYPDVIAHHVTYQFGTKPTDPLPEETSGFIVAHVDDDEKVEALVVEIGGTTKRPDGKVYHITWSINRELGAKPVHSNDVVATREWESTPRIPIRLVPKHFS